MLEQTTLPVEVVTEPERAALVSRMDEAGQVMDLFRRAFEGGGATPEALAQLVALKEQIDRRNAELEFAQALADFQRACPPIPRTSVAHIATRSGTGFDIKYADFEQITEVVRPAIDAVGLSVGFSAKMDGKMLVCIGTLRHRNGHHAESEFPVPTDTASAMSAQQAFGSAFTFAKRNCLMGLLGLSVTDPSEPGGSAGAEAITEGQALDMESLIQEVKADRPRFLKHFGIAKVSELRQCQHAEAVRMLEAKRKAPQ